MGEALCRYNRFYIFLYSILPGWLRQWFQKYFPGTTGCPRGSPIPMQSALVLHGALKYFKWSANRKCFGTTAIRPYKMWRTKRDKLNVEHKLQYLVLFTNQFISKRFQKLWFCFMGRGRVTFKSLIGKVKRRKTKNGKWKFNLTLKTAVGHCYGKLNLMAH